MSQLYKVTYTRRQVITDFLAGEPMRETVNLITEVIGGLPSSTVANYRKVLGDQFVSAEPEERSEVTPRLGSGRDGVRVSKRSQVSKKVMGAAAEEDDALSGSYAGLITKMANKANAA